MKQFHTAWSSFQVTTITKDNQKTVRKKMMKTMKINNKMRIKKMEALVRKSSSDVYRE